MIIRISPHELYSNQGLTYFWLNYLHDLEIKLNYSIIETHIRATTKYFSFLVTEEEEILITISKFKHLLSDNVECVGIKNKLNLITIPKEMRIPNKKFSLQEFVIDNMEKSTDKVFFLSDKTAHSISSNTFSSYQEEAILKKEYRENFVKIFLKNNKQFIRYLKEFNFPVPL
jgi:virulence-associated protein VagC